MKIIVDEIPKEPKECIFSEYDNGYLCCLCEPESAYCVPNKCGFLKPITDFHAEKVIEKYDDGSCTVQQFDIR